ncbi:MAG: hypothetical protein ACKVTZ_07015, partial [Bacteroidia bacterium]
MKKIFFSLIFLLQLLHAQTITNEDCRLKEKYLHPLIQPFNPFFTEHKWLALMQQEMGRLDENRYLVISHHGCKRHFIAFNLYLKATEVVEVDSFWVQEASNTLRSVYYGTPEYGNFGQDFEDRFTERLTEIGLNKEFNFPIGNKNYLCEITFPTPNNDAKIRVESIELLFEEEIAEKKR